MSKTLRRAGRSLPVRVSATLLLATLLLAALSAGCPIRLIAEYDSVLDQETTRLQADMETFLTRMEAKAGSPAGVYAENQGFYEDVTGRLAALRARTEATPKAELLTQHLEELGKNVELLRTLHEKRGEKGLPPALVEPARAALDTQFRALLKLSAALRRGEGT